MESVGEPILVQTVRGHKGEITCADVFGKRLITGGGDKALRLWHWQAGTGWIFTGEAKLAHRYGVTAGRWAPAGTMVASAGVDGAVRVWTRELVPRRLLAAPAAPAARTLCWATYTRLLTGYDDGTICVWDVAGGTLAARLAVHEGSLHALTAPACGALILAACTNAVLKVFDLNEVCSAEEGTSPNPLFWMDSVHDLGALCADSSEDGHWAATGGHDSKIRLWRIKKIPKRCAEGPILEGHTAAVTSVRWSKGILASASLDRSARLWSPEAGCIRVIQAHSRYLTCVALASDLKYLVTGSNDKTVRIWSLGSFTINDEIEVECSSLVHFGLGDLEGIEPVKSGDILEAEFQHESGDEEASCGGARQIWYSNEAHSGAINSISAYRDLIVTGSSDGYVRVFRWNVHDGTLLLEHEVSAGRYPILTVDIGIGVVVVSAGLDPQAEVWDLQSGCRLRSFCAPASAAEREAGGGGVRGARLSPHKPPMLLLATDDGVLAVWNIADDDPTPLQIYGGWTGAVTCCAWSSDGRILCGGTELGELRAFLAPPSSTVLAVEMNAHDLGVQSCDFAPSSAELADNTYSLATAGSDSFTKLWLVELTEDLQGVQISLRLLRQLAAHSGAVTVARWDQSGSLLATGGIDEWARVWTTAPSKCVAALSAGGNEAGSVLAVAFTTLTGADGSTSPVLALGTLAGELALWRLSISQEIESDDGIENGDGTPVQLWNAKHVARWIQEFVTRAPGFSVSKELENILIEKVMERKLSGSSLLEDTIEEILVSLENDNTEYEEVTTDWTLVRERLVDELIWLKRDFLMDKQMQVSDEVAHELLCPLTHCVMHEPARAADGFTYERSAIAEWFVAADGAISPMTGRRMHNARLQPNYKVRDALRELHREHHPG